MRLLVAIVASVAAAAAATTARGMQPPVLWSPVASAPPAATLPPARGTTVSVSGYPLVCGRPGGTITVLLPPRAHLPQTIAARAVTVNGIRPAAVSVSSHGVEIVLARPPGVTCYSIALGPLQIRFAPSVHIGIGTRHTAHATVRHGAQTYPARVTIRA